MMTDIKYEYIEGLDNQPCLRCDSTNTWYDKSYDDDITTPAESCVVCRDCGCNT